MKVTPSADDPRMTFERNPPQSANRAQTAENPRSSYGSVPGEEFPAGIYRMIIAAFAWIMLVSWLSFGQASDDKLPLEMATVLMVILLGLPVIAIKVATGKVRRDNAVLSPPLVVDTATGPVGIAEASLQVLIIPLSLALSATLFAAAWALAV